MMGAVSWRAMSLILVGVLAGLIVALALSLRGNRDHAPSGVGSSPGASLATPTGSAVQTVIPTASGPIERQGWTPIQVTEDTGYDKIVGVEGGAQVVVAFGQADRHRLGIWTSSDGRTWQLGKSPELAAEFGGRLVDVAATVDGFVGVAALGLPEGSEQITTAVYTSADGLDWKAAASPVDGDWIASAIEAIGSRIVVAGASGVFISDDAGQSWQRSADQTALGGQITSLFADDQLLLAGGYSGTLGSQQPLLWKSADSGTTWERVSLGKAGSASNIVVGRDGTIVVFGSIGEDAVVWRSDGGVWSSQVLATCCLRGATATPTGYVAVGVPFSGGPQYVAKSTDAKGWALEMPNLDELTGIGWTDRLGLLATTDSGQVVLAPTPYP